MGFKLAEAFVELRVNDGAFRRAMRGVRTSIARTVRSMASLASAAVRVGSAFAAIGGAFSVFAVRAASDAEEIRNKFQAVFKDQTDAATRFSRQLALALGRSQTDIQRFMAQFQDTFVPMGLARDESRRLSEQLTALAFDLSSFNNMPASEAVDRLTSGLIGNHEALQRFGVVIKENVLSSQLMAMGLARNNQEATELQKVQARLAIILGATRDAEGDVLRTSGSLANMTRRLSAMFRDMQEALGRALMPIAKEFVGLLMDMLRAFRELSRFGEGVFKPALDALKGIVKQMREAVEFLTDFFRGAIAQPGLFFETLKAGLDLLKAAFLDVIRDLGSELALQITSAIRLGLAQIEDVFRSLNPVLAANAVQRAALTNRVERLKRDAQQFQATRQALAVLQVFAAATAAIGRRFGGAPQEAPDQAPDVGLRNSGALGPLGTLGSIIASRAGVALAGPAVSQIAGALFGGQQQTQARAQFTGLQELSRQIQTAALNKEEQFQRRVEQRDKQKIDLLKKIEDKIGNVVGVFS